MWVPFESGRLELGAQFVGGGIVPNMDWISVRVRKRPLPHPHRNPVHVRHYSTAAERAPDGGTGVPVGGEPLGVHPGAAVATGRIAEFADHGWPTTDIPDPHPHNPSGPFLRRPPILKPLADHCPGSPSMRV
ncbi:hypothetical protein AWN90_34600 [Nocardia terpenica]|uniref:Uncharacterized protein n=1 Tax=Nocardia terpenica TaxID=455432 RepID=A0A164MVT2_9NOCA|nr:hypothetical protein AWN90_34600 [Nocardia terpenica]